MAHLADAKMPADRLRAALDSANQHFRAKQYGLAFAFYLVAVQLDPSIKDSIKRNFSSAFQIATEELMRADRVEELLHCHAQVCRLFPECEGALNVMGTQLFRLGCPDEAAACFRRALLANPGLSSAGSNLDNVRSHLVERWHFPMLNDRSRNEAFQLAIAKAVARGYDTVLDIGTGTGILSMLAVTAGAKQVVACEMSKTMFEVAQSVLHVNDMANSVRIIHKCSTDLTVPGDLPARVSLVVTETFDAGLFGEGILPTLRHAWDHLLLPPQPLDAGMSKAASRVIPMSAVLYACLIESEEIRKQSTLVGASCCGLDLSGLAQQTPDFEHALVNGAGSELYSCARLRELRGGVRYLSQPQVITKVSFNDVNDIACHMDGSKDGVHRLPCTGSGHLDAVAAWFDLHLDDDVLISTAPMHSTCWEQVVCPLRHSCTDSATGRPWRCIDVGDVVDVSFSIVDGVRVSLSCTGIARSDGGCDRGGAPCPCLAAEAAAGGVCAATAARCTSVSSSCGSETSVLAKKPRAAASGTTTPYFPADDELYLANDTHYHEAFSAALSAVLRRAPPCPAVGGGSSSVLDVTGSFSLLGPLALRCGATLTTLCGRIVADSGRAEAVRALSAIAAAAAADPGQATAMDVVDALPPAASDRQSHDGRGAIRQGFTCVTDVEQCKREWDVIVYDPVEPCGALRCGALEDVALACISCLRPGGSVLPRGFTIRGVCVSSPQLAEMCRVVDDKRTLGLHVSALMNEFQMSIAVDLDASTLPHEKLCNDFAAIEVHFSPLADAGLSSMEQSNSTAVRVVKSGAIVAVLYWFELHLDGENRLSTADGRCHWKQAAAILPKEIAVKEGDTLTIWTTIRESCVSIAVE